MLLSLETVLDVEALVVRNAKATSNLRYRRVGAIRPGSKNISKADWGNTGTQESLTSPNESRLLMDRPNNKESRRARFILPPCKASRKGNIGRYPRREKSKVRRRTKAVLASS